MTTNDTNIRRTLSYIRSVKPQDEKKKETTWRHCPNRRNLKQLAWLRFVREKGLQVTYQEFDPDFTRKPNYLPERYDFGWLKGEDKYG